MTNFTNKSLQHPRVLAIIVKAAKKIKSNLQSKLITVGISVHSLCVLLWIVAEICILFMAHALLQNIIGHILYHRHLVTTHNHN